MRYSVLFLLTSLAGCASEGPAPKASSSGDVFGEPIQVTLLEPYQGDWHFDLERTMALWKVQGISSDMIALGRGFLPILHQDLAWDGHVASGSGQLSEEFRFFALHEHDGVVCGKAWHHEDRFDPGDMSKCHVKLQLVKGELHLDVKMQEEQVDLNDPDLISSPPLLLDAASCDAPDAVGSDRNGWSTYVFVRSLTGPETADSAN